MRKTLLTLALAALAVASSFAASVSGTYRLVPDAETRAFCKRHRLPLPTGRLVLREDRTFTLTVSDDEGVHKTLGRYDIEADEIFFDIESGEGVDLPKNLLVEGSRLEGSGASFELDTQIAERPARRKPRQRPVEVVVPPVVERAAPRVERPIEVAPARPRMDSVQGVWTLRRNGNEDRTCRFTFERNGTFSFTGMNSTSRGRYTFDGTEIELVWHEIDGAPVEAGHVVRKRLPITFDGEAFFVDQYRYERGR